MVFERHAIDIPEAKRIAILTPGFGDAWANDFPFDGDVNAVGSLLRSTSAFGEQRPFGYYRITHVSDQRAIGGVGFKGRPERGCIEIGNGLAPSARGHGYAAAAVNALLTVAIGTGLPKVSAGTTLDNVSSQRTLIRSGFSLVSTEAELLHCEVILRSRTTELGL